MTKKEYCMQHETVAYYSGFSGLEIKGVEYGINDYVYCVSGVWGAKSNQRFHRLKIHYTNNGNDYIMLHGYRVMLRECIRV